MNIDLSEFIKFEIIWDNPKLFPTDDFDFYVQTTRFTSKNYIAKFIFVDPLALSRGKSPDIARATIINPILFSSKDSGNVIKNGTVIEIEIPRQFRT